MRKALIARTGDWLFRTSAPRFTVIIGMSVGALAAYGSSNLLLKLGLQGMALRYPLSFVGGWLAAVVFLQCWILSIRDLDTATLMLGAPGEAETREPGDEDSTTPDGFEQAKQQFQASIENAIGDGFAQAGPRAVAGMLVLVTVFGMAFVACHGIQHARWYLGKLLVASGKVWHRALAASEFSGWFVVPLVQTAALASVLVLHYAFLGLALQLLFPQATTVADVIRAL